LRSRHGQTGTPAAQPFCGQGKGVQLVAIGIKTANAEANRQERVPGEWKVFSLFLHSSRSLPLVLRSSSCTSG
jgi:hypothetical protein